MEIRQRIIMFVLVLLITGSISAQNKYNYVFNPVKGFVDETEKPWRDELNLNGRWQFMPMFENDIRKFKKPDQFSWDDIPLKIPSPWNVNSFAKGDGGDFLTFPSYPEKWEYATMGWMKKDFKLPDEWTKKLVKLHFEAIAGYAKIFVNGLLAGENLDIFFPTELDITNLLKPGKNEILVGVAKASLTDDPGDCGRRKYVAGSFWGQHIAGIWQDVSLIAVPALHIVDVFVQPDVASDQLNFNVTIRNDSEKKQTFFLEASIREWYKEKTEDINLAPVQNGTLKDEVLRILDNERYIISPRESLTLKLTSKVNGKLKYWTPNTPNLYGSIISLKTGEKIIDRKYTRFGWRQFTIDGSNLLLNGKRIVLKGDSWHFMGIPQMTRRYAWAWFKMLKEANANAVRLHAQPYPSFYLDVADEMGICVLDETGIWASDGGPKMDSDDYWLHCKKHLKNLVLRDRNHPSVFGWGICNETLPVAIHVFHAPEAIVQRQIQEINQWVTLVRDLDPTRDWISGDGETMRATNLPTVIGHYGDEGSMKEWSSKSKPWGVGETGMAYYGTPKQVASINGNRAYESQLGRMEGLASEAYYLIGKQLEYKASYVSVFNIIWYGLKPLPFGLKDTSKPPTLEDGIFFPDFIEGIPGIQPERLGPYTSTVNPGYDPRLPLYDPWPMFDAVQAIYSEPPKAFVIENKKFPDQMLPSIEKIKKVGIISSENSDLKKYLVNIGVPLIDLKDPQDLSCGLLIIDGRTALLDHLDQKIAKKAIDSGTMVLVWGINPNILSDLNEILPFSVELTCRESTSFLLKEADPMLAGLGHKDFYFTEISPQPIMKNGLRGELVEKGIVLVEACNTDWRRWNSRPEYLKTAAVYRSEQEAKPSGAAIVKVTSGKAVLYINNINIHLLGSDGETLCKRLLSNLGVQFIKVSVNCLNALSVNGNLERALVFCPDVGYENLPNDKFLEMVEKKENPLVIQTNAQGFFEFGRKEKVALSFWIFSPRSLVDLLVEPNMPKLDVRIEGNHQEASLFVNGNSYARVKDNNKIESLPLEKGWNHIFIELKKNLDSRDWKTKIKLESNREEFWNQLNSSIGHYQ